MRQPRPSTALRAVAGGVAAALLSACGGSGSAAPPLAPTSQVPTAAQPGGGAGVISAWKKCTGKDQSAYECATLPVKVDHADPASATLPLALIRKKATGDRIGSLLLNPGGPGGSTLGEFDFLYQGLSDTLRARFDVVGFDPRGVGESDPVRCSDGPFVDRYLANDADITTDAGLQSYLADVTQFAKDCQANSGDLLPHVGTLDAVQDMDDLRAALGDAKLTFLGYSYGTTLGTQYAEKFPDKVRALVLDGAVDQNLDALAEGRTQANGFQTAFAAFLADCTALGSTCAWRPGGDLLTAYRAIVAQARAGKITTKDAARPLTAGLAMTGVAAALYDKSYWPYLQAALAKAAAKDGTMLLALADAINGRDADGTYNSLVPSFTAITCNDEARPEIAPYVAAAKEVAATAPDFVAVLSSGLNCAAWSAPRTAPAFDGHVDGAPPIVIVGTTRDPATPLVEAQALQKEITGSVLVTRDGDGHTGYGASICIRKAADAYLVDPTKVPADGTVCPSDTTTGKASDGATVS